MPGYMRNKNPLNSRAARPGGGQNRWAVILAGGDGTRLQSFTRTMTGDERPKQFCPIFGGMTLLDQTRKRVSSTVPEHQTLVVLTKAHERFYQKSVSTRDSDLLLVQPENKGTAPAIVYALTRIAWKAPDAVVAFFPSDHYFSDDDTFMAHVEAAFEAASSRIDNVILLGINPEGPEVEYGWIEPHGSGLGSLPRAISRVRRFWEKPTPNVAKDLIKRGCLWNSFVMIGRVDSFLRMAHRTLPDLCNLFSSIIPSFETATEFKQLQELYSCIPSTNFSHEVLALLPDDLAVMKVDKVGWSDLGEPSRVLQTLARAGVQVQWGRLHGAI
jgi:mannose-1-phosphate guanylyltransferase